MMFYEKTHTLFIFQSRPISYSIQKYGGSNDITSSRRSINAGWIVESLIPHLFVYTTFDFSFVRSRRRKRKKEKLGGE